MKKIALCFSLLMFLGVQAQKYVSINKFIQVPGATGITFDERGWLIAAESANDRLNVLSFNGSNWNTIFYTGSSGSGNGNLDYPNSVYYDKTCSRLFVIELVNNRVSVFTFNGMNYDFGFKFSNSLNFTWFVKGTSNGEIAVTSRNGGTSPSRIQLLSFNGSNYVNNYLLGNGLLWGDIAFDKNNQMYATRGSGSNGSFLQTFTKIDDNLPYVPGVTIAGSGTGN